MFIAPFGSVLFKDAYLGDILTSSVKILIDLAYVSCYYASGSFLLPVDNVSNVCTRWDSQPPHAAFSLSDHVARVCVCMLTATSGGTARCFPRCPCGGASTRSAWLAFAGQRLWFRHIVSCSDAGDAMAQCLRRYFETGAKWPHLGSFPALLDWLMSTPLTCVITIHVMRRQRAQVRSGALGGHCGLLPPSLFQRHRRLRSARSARVCGTPG